MEIKLPSCEEQVKKIKLESFISELLDAVKYLSIYETKIKESRVEKIIFLPSLELQEVVSSLKIEGTHTKIEDYFEEQLIDEQGDDSIKELTNYREALNKGCRLAIFEGFNHEYFYNIHQLLFKNSKSIKRNSTIGAYKKKNNYIGHDNVHVYDPPASCETEKYMQDLIDFINKEDINLHPLIKCAIIHAQFESIHPFEDGNGRMGRLLIPIYLCQSKLLDAPLFYISEAIEKDKYQYYNSLTETRDGDYNVWIKYFLNKCIIQSKKHIEYMDLINKLYEKTTKKIEEITNSVVSRRLVDSIFTRPITSSRVMAKDLGVSVSQAKRYLVSLGKAKILFSNDKKRNVTYYFGELLQIVS